MSIKSFDNLVELLEEDISGCDTWMRKSVPPEEKLAVTLRYLATGCSFEELQYAYRLGKSAISGIVRQVCESLWRILANTIIPELTEEMWEKIAMEFEKRAYFPNCIGAIDGKHIRIIMPQHSGSLYHNYKKYLSIVLLTVCDSNDCFIFIDIGAYGKSSDSAIFKNTVFYRRLLEKSLNIPPPKSISDNNPLVFSAYYSKR